MYQIFRCVAGDARKFSLLHNNQRASWSETRRAPASGVIGNAAESCHFRFKGICDEATCWRAPRLRLRRATILHLLHCTAQLDSTLPLVLSLPSILPPTPPTPTKLIKVVNFEKYSQMMKAISIISNKYVFNRYNQREKFVDFYINKYTVGITLQRISYK